ncbi:kinase domain protein [Ceratobasidium sp. AG-Ba]|nr:kinase domain protein [Ceratobasidium sp. AG-Ba]
MSSALTRSPNTSIRPPEERSEAEQRWVSFQPYLHSKGYRLRPRYQPDWIPSWTTTSADPYDCEDSSNSLPLRRLDATRIADELQVVIKMLIPSSNDREGDQELEILQHFSSPPLKNDPANHVVPCLDSFPIPDVEGGMFFVMPLLGKYKNPPFYSISEIHDFLVQIFEGLEFLHKHDIAHCDIAPANIMMDKSPLYDQPSHPYHQHLTLDAKRPLYPKYSRSQKPVRYYYIDFGYAVWFKDSTTPREITGAVGKEIAPEQVREVTYDPFKVDIYQLGAILRRDLIPVRSLRFPVATHYAKSFPRNINR